MIRHLVLVAAVATASGCAGVEPLDGFAPIESASIYLDSDRPEEALAMAELVLDSGDDIGPALTADATFIAAESELLLGRHLRAFRHYRKVLETAPWSPHVTVIEDRLFEIGLAFLYDEEYGGWFDSRGRGVEVLELLQLHFRRSDRADDALRHVGDYFSSPELREWEEAALTYEQLYREYPDSEWAERALWLAGHCRLELVHGPEYNHEGLLAAVDLLQESLEVHPKGVAALSAKEDLSRARSLLARAEILVADFYAARGVAEGERVRLANAALLYPATEAGREAAARLVALGLDSRELALSPSASSTDKARATRTSWSGR